MIKTMTDMSAVAPAVEPDEPMVAVWDVDTGEAKMVPPAVAAAGMIAYARGRLGAGTPACAVVEAQALALLREHGLA
jgi:hypothetical protein